MPAIGTARPPAGFWRAGPDAAAPPAVALSPSGLRALGNALYAATVAPSAAHPTGLIRFALHPVALPRLPGLDDLDQWLAIALERMTAVAASLGTDTIAARTGVRDITVWLRDGSACAQLCEQWLESMTATALIGREQRLIVGPSAAWCVLPADGSVLGYLLDALDVVFDPREHRPRRPAIPVSSLARERDIEERREALTGTLAELAQSGRARWSAEPLVDAQTGLACGMHLRAEFRSLFAVADLVDYLPDIVDDDATADVLNEWAATAIGAARLPGDRAVRTLQIRVAPAQLLRMDSLASLVRSALHAAQASGSGCVPCLMLPEAAVHRNAYLVIDAAAEVAALGATLGVDDYRGLLPPSELARAGVRTLRLHRSLVRDLTERRFAQDRLAALLAEAHACSMRVTVAGLSGPGQVAAACAAGTLELAGPLFGRAQRLDASGMAPPARV